MNWKTFVTLVVLAPFVALLGGVGLLFYQIGQHWDARSTDSLIAGLVATCGGGMVIIGVLLALLVGIPFAIRMFGEAGYARRSWEETPPWRSLPSARVPSWASPPPLLEDKSAGQWQTMGQTYDLWEEPRPVDIRVGEDRFYPG